MAFQDLVAAAQKHFPDLQVKFKDQSKFMKFLSILLFFNKSFMTSYTTTVGSTIYFPSENSIKNRPTASSITLLHELVHVNDAKKISKPLFGFLYLTPQILVLLIIPLFFVLPWWSVLLIMALFLVPLPSFFRMHYEKRAYFSSLYAIHNLSNKLHFKSFLSAQKAHFLEHFKNSSYYFMWPFSNLDKEFDEAMVKIQANQRPFEDPIFDIIDELIKTV